MPLAPLGANPAPRHRAQSKALDLFPKATTPFSNATLTRVRRLAAALLRPPPCPERCYGRSGFSVESRAPRRGAFRGQTAEGWPGGRHTFLCVPTEPASMVSGPEAAQACHPVELALHPDAPASAALAAARVRAGPGRPHAGGTPISLSSAHSKPALPEQAALAAFAPNIPHTLLFMLCAPASAPIFRCLAWRARPFADMPHRATLLSTRRCRSGLGTLCTSCCPIRGSLSKVPTFLFSR